MATTMRAFAGAEAGLEDYGVLGGVAWTERAASFLIKDPPTVEEPDVIWSGRRNAEGRFAIAWAVLNEDGSLAFVKPAEPFGTFRLDKRFMKDTTYYVNALFDLNLPHS